SCHTFSTSSLTQAITGVNLKGLYFWSSNVTRHYWRIVAGPVASKSKSPVKPLNYDASNPVEASGIVGKKFPFVLRVEALHRFEPGNRVELARGIAMAVVGTDNQIFLARVRDHIRKVVIGLGRNIDPVVAEAADRDRMFASQAAPHNLVNDQAHPLGRGLDETPAQLREDPRYLAHDQRVACGDCR